MSGAPWARALRGSDRSKSPEAEAAAKILAHRRAFPDILGTFNALLVRSQRVLRPVSPAFLLHLPCKRCLTARSAAASRSAR